jgi:hypothetical protein
LDIILPLVLPTRYSSEIITYLHPLAPNEETENGGGPNKGNSILRSYKNLLSQSKGYPASSVSFSFAP